MTQDEVIKKPNKELLDEIATELTGIKNIEDFEYQYLSYSKKHKGKTIQKRNNFFKASKRFL